MQGKSATPDDADRMGGRGSRRAAPRRTPGPRKTRKDAKAEKPSDTTDCTDDTDRERRLTQRKQRREESGTADERGWTLIGERKKKPRIGTNAHEEEDLPAKDAKGRESEEFE